MNKEFQGDKVPLCAGLDPGGFYAYNFPNLDQPPPKEILRRNLDQADALIP